MLTALRRIIDPDLGKDVVDCGFVRDLRIDRQSGGVDFTLRLTTPACPIKDDFRQKAEQYVGEIGWVQRVGVKMDADPPQPLTPNDGRSQGLSKVAHIIAVSSCKGGRHLLLAGHSPVSQSAQLQGSVPTILCAFYHQWSIYPAPGLFHRNTPCILYGTLCKSRWFSCSLGTQIAPRRPSVECCN